MMGALDRRIPQIALALILIAMSPGNSMAFTALSATGCGTTKTCYRDPSTCDPSTNCVYYVAWTMQSNGLYLDVEMSGTISTSTNYYIAIGFSTDQSMASDGVTACYYTGSAITFWNGYTNPSGSPGVVTVNAATDFLLTNSTADGGSYTAASKVIQCRFKRLLVPANANLKDLKTSLYYIMFANGPFNTGTNMLTRHANRYVSSSSYNLTVNTASITSSGVTLRKINAVSNSGCGQTKSCFKATDGTFVSWKPIGNMIEIEMSGVIPTSSGYIAIGFSSDNQMGNDNVIGCVASSSGIVTARVGYNVDNSKFNSYVASVPSNFLVTTSADNSLGGSYTSSSKTISCRLRREIKPTSNVVQLKDLSDSFKYYILIARGSAAGSSGLRKHGVGLVSVSSSSVDVSSTSYVVLGGLKYNMAKAHGSLMIIAWLLFTPIGLLMPQRFKCVWGDRMIGGLKAWFQIHRALQVSCLVLTVIAFILIFAAVRGYTSAATLPQKAHPIIGIIVTALCIINPIMALFRPAPDAPKRQIFNWAHRIVGSVAFILSVTAVIIGFRMDKAGTMLPTMDAPMWIVIGFIIYGFIISILFCVVDHKCKDSNDVQNVAGVDNVGMEMSSADGRGSTATISGNKSKKPQYYNILLVCYVVGALGCVIALLVLIGLY